MDIIKLHILALSAVVLQGCVTDSDEYVDRPLPNCGHVSGSWVGGSERSGWRDEGNGYISNHSSNWSDTPVIGDDALGPTANILHCPTGEGLLIGFSSKSQLSPRGFLAAAREQNDIGNTDLFAKAKALNLNVRKTTATQQSKIAKCGCDAYYPNLKPVWMNADE